MVKSEKTHKYKNIWFYVKCFTLKCAGKLLLWKKVFVINSPFFCNRAFTLIFATFRSRDSIMSFHAFVLSLIFSIQSIDLIITFYSHKYLQPFSPKTHLLQNIKVAALVPITKEQTTIKRNNEHFYYILIIFQLPEHAQPRENILATGISREPLPTTLQYKLMGGKLPLTKTVKRQLLSNVSEQCIYE